MDIQYKIIGGDHREYGPISLEDLKSWIQEGRVSGTTMIWRSDTNAWLPASRYVELQPFVGGQPGAAPAQSIGDFRPVGFWARLGAFIIDLIILNILSSAVWILVSKITGWTEPQPLKMGASPEEMMRWLTDTAVPYVLRTSMISHPIRIIYQTLMNGRFGATVGKMAIGAQIVHLDGSPIGYKTAFLRSLAELLSQMICYIGYLFIAFRPDKRALHDLIVGTRVVYKRK